MTLSSGFTLRWKGARPGTVDPTPYSFPWFEQQLAAFLLIRGPHAFFGTAWGVGLVHEWRSEYDTDVGEPAGRCAEVSPGVFARNWTRAAVMLDCNAFHARIEPAFN